MVRKWKGKPRTSKLLCVCFCHPIRLVVMRFHSTLLICSPTWPACFPLFLFPIFSPYIPFNPHVTSGFSFWNVGRYLNTLLTIIFLAPPLSFWARMYCVGVFDLGCSSLGSLLFFFFKNFYFMHMDVLPVCVSMHYLHACGLWKSEGVSDP